MKKILGQMLAASMAVYLFVPGPEYFVTAYGLMIEIFPCHYSRIAGEEKPGCVENDELALPDIGPESGQLLDSDYSRQLSQRCL